jgi:cytoskeletal protein CcmA (bactofilin family)
MKNPFKSKGFDTIIAKGQSIEAISIDLPKDTLTVIDGSVKANATGSKVDGEGDLTVNGALLGARVVATTLTVTGIVTAGFISVDTLHMKKGSQLSADTVTCRVLNVEPGAVLEATIKPPQDVGIPQAD